MVMNLTQRMISQIEFSSRILRLLKIQCSLFPFMSRFRSCFETI